MTITIAIIIIIIIIIIMTITIIAAIAQWSAVMSTQCRRGHSCRYVDILVRAVRS